MPVLFISLSTSLTALLGDSTGQNSRFTIIIRKCSFITKFHAICSPGYKCSVWGDIGQYFAEHSDPHLPTRTASLFVPLSSLSQVTTLGTAKCLIRGLVLKMAMSSWQRKELGSHQTPARRSQIMVALQTTSSTVSGGVSSAWPLSGTARCHLLEYKLTTFRGGLRSFGLDILVCCLRICRACSPG